MARWGLYKWLEAAAYVRGYKDEEIDRQDSIIKIIGINAKTAIFIRPFYRGKIN